MKNANLHKIFELQVSQNKNITKLRKLNAQVVFFNHLYPRVKENAKKTKK